MAARHLVSISLGSYSGSGANLDCKAGEPTAYSPSTETDVSSPRFLFPFRIGPSQQLVSRGSSDLRDTAAPGQLSRIPGAVSGVYYRASHALTVRVFSN